MLIEKKREYGDFLPFLQKEEQFNKAIHELTTYNQKQNHWMWFLFPNLAKYGESYYSKYFGFYDENEAKLFYKNKILNKRLFCLFEIVDTLLNKHSIKFIMTTKIDRIKFQSCIDLFYSISNQEKEVQLLESLQSKLFVMEKESKK